MLYYSTLVKFELKGQILSLKCNNFKEIQTEYPYPYKTRQKFFICALVSFFHGSMCSVLGCASATLGQKDVAALALLYIPSAGTQMWFSETQ